MRTEITIQYTSGEAVTYVAAPPEWAKWESKTGFSIQQASEKIGVSDLLFLAYNAMKREAAGKPVKPIEIWTETVSNVEVGDVSPKAIPSEA